MTDEIEFFLVGGAIRDELLGLRSKDHDFTVVAPSYDAMRERLIADGFRIFMENPEFFTIRARVPEGNPLRNLARDADFVMARVDGPSSDGRRPDFTLPGTLADDLARRDFTVNAMAKAADGTIIDPHGGRDDLDARILRFVGDPMTRIGEDGLRVIRAFRFMVTKGFMFDNDTSRALRSLRAAKMLEGVAIERVFEELRKMFEHDFEVTMQTLNLMPSDLYRAIFRDGLRLTPTLK